MSFLRRSRNFQKRQALKREYKKRQSQHSHYAEPKEFDWGKVLEC